MHRVPRIWLPTFLIAFGCSHEANPNAGSARAEPPVQEGAPGRGQSAGPWGSASAQPLRSHLDLMESVHLADVDQGGLLVDFGTPARDKYTMGDWNTGWGEDAVEGDATFTYAVSEAGRLYLPLPTAGAFSLRLRLAAIGTGTLQLYLNNKPLPALQLRRGEGFAEYDVEVPPGLAQPGENYLLLRFGGTTRHKGAKVAAAVDYLRVLPVDPAQRARPLPRYGTLVREVTLGQERRTALLQEAPAVASYHVEVPEGAQLRIRVGAARDQPTVKVRVTPSAGAPKDILTAAAPAGWREALVSLAAYAGQVVKLDLVAEGTGQVAWSNPALVVPEVTVDKAVPVKSAIVLLIDTLRASKLRTYNPKEVVETPVLARLAEEGTVFDSAQAPENWTKPSVASVLTSLYPLTHRTKYMASKLPRGALMVSQVFKKAGFSTASFLANGYVSNKFGFDKGWDHYTNYIREARSTEAENVFREAGDWIQKHKDERFFVYIQTIDPHVPYDPPQGLLKKYDPDPYNGIVKPRMTANLLEQAKRVPPKITFSPRDRKHLEALHNGEISYHDAFLGRFIERLKKLGLYDEVLFVVTSDHGEEFYEHGSYGHGHSVYQEMIHVPLMFRRPGLVPAGRRVPQTVSTMDIAPTVLTAAGLAVPPVMEGENRLDHIRGELPAGPAVAFTDFLVDRHVIRAGRYKLIVNGTKPTFFDLQTDPGERKELDYHKHPVAMRYCRTLLGQFLGASDRGHWLAADQQRKARPSLDAEDTDIDDETRKQLKALGYAN